MSEEQQEKSIIECIRDFIKKCPHLPDYYKSIGVDYLDSGVASYMIEAVPCKLFQPGGIFRRYNRAAGKFQIL